MVISVVFCVKLQLLSAYLGNKPFKEVSIVKLGSVSGYRYAEESLKNSTKAGNQYGLKLTLFIDAEEYIGILAPRTGARVLIHDPYTVSDDGASTIAAAAGETTSISLKMEKTSLLGDEYGNCATKFPEVLMLDKKLEEAILKYSQDLCTTFCLIHSMSLRCCCLVSLPDLKGFTANEIVNNCSQNVCDTSDKEKVNCVNRIYEDSKNGDLGCDCPLACQSTDYILTTSRSPWPSKSFAPFLASKLLQSKSRRILEYTQNLVSRPNITEEILQKNFKENFVRVEIFFESLTFKMITSFPAYEFADLGSDFGAYIGLWLGWSIFVIFDVIEFIIHCFEALIVNNSTSTV